MTVAVHRAIDLDAAAIAHIHVDTWRTAYRGIMTEEFLSSLSYTRRQHMWEDILKDSQNTTRVFIAEENGHPLGFAACGPAREEKEFNGELYAIYVTQISQRRGIGRMLARSVVRDLVTRGFDSMLVWVLADNPSRGFYEALGGELVRTREVEVGGQKLEELGYGWKRLDSLVS
jgi:ribosomal protein S18 acetylase RimI-like enzyme